MRPKIRPQLPRGDDPLTGPVDPGSKRPSAGMNSFAIHYGPCPVNSSLADAAEISKKSARQAEGEDGAAAHTSQISHFSEETQGVSRRNSVIADIPKNANTRRMSRPRKPSSILAKKVRIPS